jgi:hypothetical protein
MNNWPSAALIDARTGILGALPFLGRKSRRAGLVRRGLTSRFAAGQS